MPLHLVIIGNGIAGITAARFVRKRNATARITIISDESDHFYARTALMYIYMGHLRFEDTKPYENRFWSENRIDCVRDYVEEVDTSRRCLALRSGRSLTYDALVIATGSKPAFYGWPGEELVGVQGLYGLPDLEEMDARTRGIRRAVVVGGGLIGVEMAEMLHSRGIPVTFLVREEAYLGQLLPAEESELVRREIERNGIDLRLGTELGSILSDAQGRARAVVTTAGEEIACEFVGIATGVVPNIQFLQNSGVAVNRGVLVNEFFETNQPGVYAVGDCAEIVRKGEQGRIEQLWYTGRAQGKAVASTLCGDRRPYHPGLYFNSAKFFTLEYQTYGTVTPRLTAGEDSVLWQDDRGRKLLRIQYETSSRRVVGFNVLGTRYRHETCAAWIRAGRSLEYVLDRLREANFDPELSRRFEYRLRQREAGDRAEAKVEGWLGRARKLVRGIRSGRRTGDLVAAGERSGSKATPDGR